MNFLSYVVIGAYILQLVELLFFPIPSEASTASILLKQVKNETDIQDRYFHHHITKLLILTILGMFGSTVVFILPLLFIIDPNIITGLFPISFLLHDKWQILSAVFILFGSLLSFFAVLTLRGHTILTAADRIPRLKTNGLFRFSRNPINVGLYVIIIGFVVAVPCWIMIIGLLLFVTNLHIRVLIEEKFLQQTLGLEYLQYKEKVGRYFPKIRITK